MDGPNLGAVSATWPCCADGGFGAFWATRREAHERSVDADLLSLVLKLQLLGFSIIPEIALNRDSPGTAVGSCSSSKFLIV